MRAETLEWNESWSTRREALLLGFCLWVAGLVLMVAAARQMHRTAGVRSGEIESEKVVPAAALVPNALSPADDTQNADLAATAYELAADTPATSADTPVTAAVVMPEDTLVGRRESSLGAAQMQK